MLPKELTTEFKDDMILHSFISFADVDKKNGEIILSTWVEPDRSFALIYPCAILQTPTIPLMRVLLKENHWRQAHIVLFKYCIS